MKKKNTPANLNESLAPRKSPQAGRFDYFPRDKADPLLGILYVVVLVAIILWILSAAIFGAVQ